MKTREELIEMYAEGERLMTEAAEGLTQLGGHALSPAQLRTRCAEYLHRLASIARAGGEPADEVLRLAAGGR